MAVFRLSRPAGFCLAALIALAGQSSPAAPAVAAPPAAPAPAAPAAAAPTGDLATLFTEASAAFQAGDYAKAAADLEAVLSKAEPSPQLEPLFFTLGSAYFNMNDFPKAVESFTNYQKKFPGGAHASEVALGLGQANLMAKNYDAAATQFAALERDPKFREQAFFSEGTAFAQAEKTNEAITVFEKLVAPQIVTPTQMRGAISLLRLYAKKGDSTKAIPTLTSIRSKILLVDNIVDLNSIFVELGDEFYGKKSYEEALACYRATFPREEVIRLQNERIAGMTRKMAENLAAARGNPTQIIQLIAANNQIKGQIAQAQKLLEELQKLPNITPAIYVRMGRSFYEMQRQWESIVVFDEILRRFPDAPEHEPALFSMVVSLAEVNQPLEAQTRGEEYLKQFPDGPNAPTVGYLMGAVALQSDDPKKAENYFARMLESQPKSTYREQMRYLIGNAKFMQGKYDDAAAAYQKYIQEFPAGPSIEDVLYRKALASLFTGKYEDTMGQLNAYIQKFPKGTYLGDAKYRLMVCKYAASVYDEVIADCKAWEKEFPASDQLGEVFSLEADAYAATNRVDEAIDLYKRGYKAAKTDEVLNYALFEASKQLQKKGDWVQVGNLFTEFVKDHPDSPTVVSALFWIGKAKAHEGKVDEAKQFIAETIKKYIGDPKRDAVEQLLTQLAQLCSKKKRPEPAASPAPEGASTPAPAPVADPTAELDTLLASAESEANPTAKARILFAKAELARLRRKPLEEEKFIGELAAGSKPEDLSAVLLGQVGDYLASHGKLDEAAAFYQRLMDEFPKSELLDYAYNGMGEIAFQKHDYPKALKFFSDAIDKVGASTKLKDVTLGRAKTLLALGKLPEAQKVFEQVASVREWRGEATAFSVYSLGEIQTKRGNWAEANAFYQRVFVGYQKFLPWVAKAYIGSGESFEKLGKTQEAVNTYKEMLRNEKLAALPEAAEARKRLEALGQA